MLGHMFYYAKEDNLLRPPYEKITERIVDKVPIYSKQQE